MHDIPRAVVIIWLFKISAGLRALISNLGAVSLKLIGGKFAPKLVYFVLRKSS